MNKSLNDGFDNNILEAKIVSLENADLSEPDLLDYLKSYQF